MLLSALSLLASFHVEKAAAQGEFAFGCTCIKNMDVQRKDHESSWVGSYLSLYVSWYGTSGVRALLS